MGQHVLPRDLSHNQMAEEASWGLQALYARWREHMRVRPFVVCWPGKSLKAQGVDDKTVAFDLPEGRDRWPKLLKEIATKTKARGLLVVEQQPQAIVVILETSVGTTSWHIPIKDHGDIRVLADIVEHTDKDYIGVFREKPS